MQTYRTNRYGHMSTTFLDYRDFSPSIGGYDIAMIKTNNFMFSRSAFYYNGAAPLAIRTPLETAGWGRDNAFNQNSPDRLKGVRSNSAKTEIGQCEILYRS